MPWLAENRCTRGHSHRVFEQKYSRTCGLACCSMVMNILNSDTGWTEDMLGATYSDGVRLFGSEIDHLPPLLKNFRIQGQKYMNLQNPDGMKLIVRQATPARPVIAATIFENKTSGHWVVIANRTVGGLGKSSDYCVLDPEYGFTITSLTPGRLSISGGAGRWPGLLYIAKGGKQGVLDGRMIVCTKI